MIECLCKALDNRLTDQNQVEQKTVEADYFQN